MEDSKKNTHSFGGRITKRLLGQVLVDGEFISPHDLEAAVKQQQNTNEQLGEILVRMGAVAPTDLRVVLSIQGDLASFKDAVKAAAGVRQLFGELLLRTKKITPEQLDLALKEQKLTGEKLGEILAGKGFITERELDAVLAFQKHQSGESPVSEKFRLGEILVAAGHITREQLEDVLKRQGLSQKKIGELLIEAGYAQPHQIAYGLKLQQKLLTAALIAMLSLAAIAEIPGTGAIQTADASSSGRIQVSATVQARSTLKVLHQSPELIITNADILRGYVDVSSASRFEVKNNSLAGYLLVFEGLDGPLRPFKEAVVQGLGKEVHISAGGGMVPQPYSRGIVSLELSYHFVLSADARPGTYAWPVSISAQPL